MVMLEEDMVNPGCDLVYYQTPDELKGKDPTPAVVHDDSLPYDKDDHHDDDDDEKEEKHDHHDDEEDEDDDDHEEHHHDHDDDDEEHHEKYHDYASTIGDDKPCCDMSPIAAIRKIKCDPHCVRIVRVGGKYYIDHNDMRCYMDACGETNYECALSNIIAAHNDEDLTRSGASIVMGESDMLKLDPEIKSAMESSSVNFEVYG